MFLTFPLYGLLGYFGYTLLIKNHRVEQCKFYHFIEEFDYISFNIQ